MSERIDHATEAVRTLAQIVGVDERTNQITLALDAQVHATLALVEQQRIANLLTIAQFSHELGDGQRMFTAESAATQWRKEAEEALGLS